MHANGRPNAEQLLSLAREGRGESLGTLLELYRNYLRLLARTQIDLHLRGRVNPSDLVQETFLDACRDFGQFRGNTTGELVAWLRRILLFNLARLVQKQVLAQKRDVRAGFGNQRGGCIWPTRRLSHPAGDRPWRHGGCLRGGPNFA